MGSTIPRRADQTRWKVPELLIHKAIEEVEAMGCHPLLTDAVVKLSEAVDKVADFIELKEGE